jgi:hypothetical protein
VLAVAWLLVGLLAILAVPVDVAFRLEGTEAIASGITVRWLFGLLRVGVPIPRTRRSEPARAKAGRARASRKAGARPRRILAVLRQAAFRRRAERFMKDLVRALHVRRLRLWVRLGLGDPADTGCLWAFLGPLQALGQSLRNADVRFEPDFTDEVLEFDARGRMMLIPLEVLALAVAFALSPSAIRAFMTLWGSRG